MMLVSLIFLFLLVNGVFLFSIQLNNRAVMDVFWGLGIVMTAWLFALMGQLWWGSFVVLVLVSIWGVRLSMHLFITRILKRKIDPRYIRLERNYGKYGRVKMLFNYYFQAFLQWIICMSFLHIFWMDAFQVSVLIGFGVVLAMIGIIGEWVSDDQLLKFKQQKRGGICRAGLWSISRHPNYFFDLVFWFGVSLISWTISGRLISWIPVLLMYIIFRWMTGPITESLQQERYGDEFQEYKNHVPMILPSFLSKK